jgi:hypothetical protein
MNDDHATLIGRALERYLAGVDAREAGYRALAKKYALLPILPDWTGFVGLRKDGALFWVSADDGSLSADLDDHALHLAKIRGAELFQELAFLRPTPSSDWVYCQSCGDSGKVILDGVVLENIRCRCGGIGRLPAHLAHAAGSKTT